MEFGIIPERRFFDPCTVSGAYALLGQLLYLLEPEMASRDERMILNKDEFLGLETVRGRTYRLVLEQQHKDVDGNIIVSQSEQERNEELILEGGKSRFRASLLYYDSCEDEVEENQCHQIMSFDLTNHDTKSTAFYTEWCKSLASAVALGAKEPLDISEFSPVRIIVNKHIRYTIEEEEQTSSHYNVFKNRFCSWNSFHASTASSKDDAHNFVYGGPCNSTVIAYHKQPPQYRSPVPDNWNTQKPDIQFLEIFLNNSIHDNNKK